LAIEINNLIKTDLAGQKIEESKEQETILNTEDDLIKYPEQLKIICKNLPFIQKQLIECLLAATLRFQLSNVSILQIQETRKKALEEFIETLPRNCQRVLLHFLPSFLKDLLSLTDRENLALSSNILAEIEKEDLHLNNRAEFF